MSTRNNLAQKPTDTRSSILRRYGLFASIAIALFLIGKKHIAYKKDQRHKLESDSNIDNDHDKNEFEIGYKRPGFPENNPNLNYDDFNRESKYIGIGDAYSSRRPGDRLSLYNILKQKYWPDDIEKESNYYSPSQDDKIIK
ncbi:uncharacterized protein KGF55_001387 [Candida pseudojiufengensis]|uniref:uncharacterized protein n=1 Tax=Candida pseudojiufengensis TaxID=497109 RepID=UPI0022247B8E|nr:uncharacterized protein KGF55_001387 [Candida pseudojiufengensis]KAI5965167.1 hypothetical protein KGF55_001387 [Candida pseudojiufengensis]